MTKAEFNTFCKKNSQTGVTPGEFDSLKINFENGEHIAVHAGIDGLYYIHSAERFDATQLAKDLQEATPMWYEKLKEKYGPEGFASIKTFLGNENNKQ